MSDNERINVCDNCETRIYEKTLTTPLIENDKPVCSMEIPIYTLRLVDIIVIFLVALYLLVSFA